tara:strand:+ start:363 stop:584 length:222 start_codon:yes stop_codon:yes gene_type:complete
MIGGMAPVAMAAAQTAAANPVIMIIALIVGACVILTPPCIMCSCCAFITKSIWMPESKEEEGFQNNKEGFQNM